jgi:uroporphyrinogen-III synthase
VTDQAASANARGPSVWVTRPRPGNAATADTLRAAGLPVVAVPLLETRVQVADPPPGLAWPELLILVSATAVRGLDAALARSDYPRGPREAVRVAAVGRKTAEAALTAGWRVEIVPAEENALGLLDALAAIDLAGRRVWIPAGNRPGSATRDLPDALRPRGAEVFVLPVYETLVRAPSGDDLAALDGAIPGAAVLHSPSSADALHDAGAPPAVRRWAAAAVSVSIGPVTTRRLEELGVMRMAECPEPTDGAVAATVTALDLMNPARRTP